MFISVLLASWCVLLIFAAASHAATAPAVQSGAAYPPAFVPSWDGDSDSSAIKFRLVQASSVSVVVVDGNGKVVRILQDTTRMPTGEHVVWWDGLGEAGRELPYGAYRVRVRAVPVGPSANEPGTPGSGTQVITGSQDVPVALAMPNVAIARLLLDRGYLSRAAASRRIQIRFNMLGRGPAAAAIVDARGKIVRNLLHGTIAAGNHSLLWGGGTDTGKSAPDGSYDVVISSRRGALPSRTLRTPIVIDRTAPRLKIVRVVRARVANHTVTIPLTVRTSEAARVDAAIGKRKAVWKLGAKGYNLRLPGSRVGIHASVKTRRYAVIVSATDTYGNVVRARVVVTVPGVPPARRPAPPKKPPVPPKPPTTSVSTFIWPVHGPITSGFGPRDDCSGICSSYHRGIDVGVSDGTRVVASRAGIVTLAGWNGGYGNYVEIKHTDQFSTGYGHLSKIMVPSGTFVQRGQVIALSGHTGAATGPHLHFNMTVDGILVDARKWVRGTP